MLFTRPHSCEILLCVSWGIPVCLRLLGESLSQTHAWLFLAWRQDTEILATLFIGLQLHLSALRHRERALTYMHINSKVFRPCSSWCFCACLFSSTSSLYHPLYSSPVQCSPIFIFPHIKGSFISVFIHHHCPSIPELGNKSIWYWYSGIKSNVIWNQGWVM